jgi:hypothetical protein
MWLRGDALKRHNDIIWNGFSWSTFIRKCMDALHKAWVCTFISCKFAFQELRFWCDFISQGKGSFVGYIWACGYTYFYCDNVHIKG